MLSRVADSLYWMSRYLERAEHTARLVAVNLNLTLDREPPTGAVTGDVCSASLPAAAAEGLDRRSRWTIAWRSTSPIASDRRVHYGRARERAAGARADQLGDVGADQPAVP